MELLFTLFYQPTANILFFFLDLFGSTSAVLGIMMLTLFMKVLLVPSSIKTVKMQIKLNGIADDLKSIRENIKDKKEQAEKTIELYRKAGINPLAPLMSILTQIPILMSIFFVVQDIGRREFNFSETIYSFITNPGAVNLEFLSLNIGENGGLMIAVTVLITQAILMHYSQKGITTEAAKKMQKPLTIAIPALVGIFSFFISGAVGIFWICNNLISILQEVLILKDMRMQGATDGASTATDHSD